MIPNVLLSYLYRRKVISVNITTRTTSLWAPNPRHVVGMPVVAREHLNRMRFHHHHHHESPEMRAASARIERVYVPDEYIERTVARHIAGRLGRDFGVDVVAGYPSYTREDWQQRPAWYHGLGPEDVYAKLACGTNPHPLIPFRASIPKPGETIWGGYVGRFFDRGRGRPQPRGAPPRGHRAATRRVPTRARPLHVQYPIVQPLRPRQHMPPRAHVSCVEQSRLAGDLRLA